MTEVSPESIKTVHDKIRGQLERVIVGQESVVRLFLASLFARGHCLLIGVPGLAKTLLVKTLADSLHLSFKRIQFTPDLMPSLLSLLGFALAPRPWNAGFMFLNGIPLGMVWGLVFGILEGRKVEPRLAKPSSPAPACSWMNCAVVSP